MRMGWLEAYERNVYIENPENRFADMERREESGWNTGARRGMTRSGPEVYLRKTGWNYLADKLPLSEDKLP